MKTPKSKTWMTDLLVVASLFVSILLGNALDPSPGYGHEARAEASDSQKVELLKAMAAFDRAYIPAWWLTSQEDGAAVDAMNRLHAAWQTFSRHDALRVLDAASTADLETTEARITEAETAVAAGAMREAHERLEDVRVRLRAMRLRNRLPYFLDDLVDFHETMEAIIQEANEVDRLHALLPEAIVKWDRIASTPIDNEVFHLDSRTQSVAFRFIEQEEEALDYLAVMMVKHPKKAAKIEEAAANIKPPFAGLYRCFGAPYAPR